MSMVVNTQGWTKGLGASLLASLTELTNPTHTWTLEDEQQQHQQQQQQQQQQVQRRSIDEEDVSSSSFPIASVVAMSNSRMTQSEKRTLSIVSYLYRKPKAKKDDDNGDHAATGSGWEFDVPLTHRRPWLVDWRELDQICLIDDDGAEVDRSEAAVVLNGALVALVRSQEDPDGDPRQQLSSNGDDDGSPSSASSLPFKTTPPDPTTSSVLGLGIVRAIDPSTRTFYVLTGPLDPAELADVNVIVKGDLELPVLAMLGEEEEGGTAAAAGTSGVAGVPWRSVPYLSLNRGQGEGSQRRKIRRNVMRWSQRER
jgi:polynucleotide 5'-hydroxyl-kinase GRC3/NOL9